MAEPLACGSEPEPSGAPSIFIQQAQEIDCAFRKATPLASRYPGWLRCTWFPDAFEGDRLDDACLRQALKAGQENMGGWPFLFADAGGKACRPLCDGYETVIEFEGPNYHTEFWQLRDTGFFSHARLMWEEADPDLRPRCVLHLRSLVTYVAEATRCLWRVNEVLSGSDEALVTCRIWVEGCCGRTLLAPSDAGLGDAAGVIEKDTVQTVSHHAVGSWRDANTQVAVDINAEMVQGLAGRQPATEALQREVEALYAQAAP